MAKRIVITLLTLSLLIGSMTALPVMAETASDELLYYGDMEKTPVGGVPEGVTPDSNNTAGATLGVETNAANVRSGSASLKMSNTGDTDVAMAVIQKTFIRPEELGSKETYYYLEAYFKVEGDATLTGTGVSCSWKYRVDRDPSTSTTFKSANNGNGGWQKLIVSFYNPYNNTNVVTLKLEGAGTVYWDDIVIKPHQTFINGDFAGRWGSTTIPSVWNSANYTQQDILWDNADFNSLKYIGLRHDVASNEYYVEAKGLRTNNSIGRPFKQSLGTLTKGATYKVEFDYTDGDSALAPIGLYSAQGTSPVYNSIDNTLHCNNLPSTEAAEWHHAELYIIANPNTANGLMHWEFILLANDGITKLKNIKMEEVKEESGIRNSAGNEITTIENGQEIAAWYTRPETLANYTANTLTERKVITGLYKKEGASLILEAVYIDTAKPELRFQGRYGSINGTNVTEPAGHLPGMVERTVTIPQEGDYVVKTMAWDNIGSLTPVLGAVSASTIVE